MEITVTTWALIQILVNLTFALALFFVFMRLNRQPKDDPRLSRGLQILQSKIAVLEDLSDRSDSQVRELMNLLDQKGKEINAKIGLADQQVQQIRAAMQKSLEIAEIFQDKIPHQEFVERANTVKYVRAARMAHQGISIDEISRAVDLPRGELEMITKLNRGKLVFNEEQIPWWAKENKFEAALQPFDGEGQIAEAPATLQSLGEEFRRITQAGLSTPVASATDQANQAISYSDTSDIELKY